MLDFILNVDGHELQFDETEQNLLTEGHLALLNETKVQFESYGPLRTFREHASDKPTLQQQWFFKCYPVQNNVDNKRVPMLGFKWVNVPDVCLNG
jgi:hypothetical protein